MESSSFGRLIGALIAPVKTFRSIAERPTWLVAFLVVCLVPVVPGILAKPKIDWDEIAQAQFEQMDQKPSPEQMEQQIDIMKKVGGVMTYLSPLMFAITLLLMALVFWGAFTLAGGQSGFARSLAVVSHGMLPWSVSMLLSIPIIIRLDTIGADLAKAGTYLKSNLASFASEDASPVLLALLSKIDVFSLWCLVLFGIGFTYSAKVKPGTSATVVGLLWLVLWVGVSVFFAWLGTMMGGKG